MINSEELYKRRLHEEAVAIERVNFTKTDRRVNPIKVNPLIYQRGNIPLLISAPHSVRYMRQKKIKVSDEFTGATALLLNKLTGCHSLAVAKLYGGDPNTDGDCLYKDYLAKLCQENKFKLIIDLHACSRESGIDVNISSKQGGTIAKYPAFLTKILDVLNNAGFKSITQDLYNIEENSVTNYVSLKLGIPAIQFEINKKYRVPHQNGLSYCKVLAAMMEIISLISNKGM